MPQRRDRVLQVQRLRAILFGELLPVCRQHQRRVQVLRRGQAKRPLQCNLPRRVVRQVLTAHHMGHALGGVVHHHRQLVGPQTVSPAQHKVSHRLRNVLRLQAGAPVVPLHRAGYS